MNNYPDSSFFSLIKSLLMGRGEGGDGMGREGVLVGSRKLTHTQVHLWLNLFLCSIIARAVSFFQVGSYIFRNSEAQFFFFKTPQWGAADTEIKVPLKPGVGQYIAVHAAVTARDSFLTNFCTSGPFTCIFSKTPPEFFMC